MCVCVYERERERERHVAFLPGNCVIMFMFLYFYILLIESTQASFNKNIYDI